MTTSVPSDGKSDQQAACLFHLPPSCILYACGTCSKRIVISLDFKTQTVPSSRIYETSFKMSLGWGAVFISDGSVL